MPDESTPGQFPSTVWTLVLAAGSDATRAMPALESLCRGYWQPLYAFARRKGHPPDVSEDAVQGFLESLLARSSLSTVEREGGRFRSWLLGGFVHHLKNLHRKERAARRGGGVVPISLEEAEAVLPADQSLSPDEAFDRRWAELVLASAVERLRQQQERTGKAELWRVLGPVITGRAATRYESLADSLGMSPEAVGVQIHRLRRRLRDLVRSEVARTVLTADDLEGEFSYLLGLFQRP